MAVLLGLGLAKGPTWETNAIGFSISTDGNNWIETLSSVF